MALRMFTNKVANVLAKQYGDRVRYELMQVGRSLPCSLSLEGSPLVLSLVPACFLCILAVYSSLLFYEIISTYYILPI
jgi:hypothetical protein